MYIKTIEYKDYDGNMRKEDFYFNYNIAELTEMDLTTEGGFKQRVAKIANAQDIPEMAKLWKGMILGAYGEKSPNGRDFIKRDPATGVDLYKYFEQSAAYPVLFMELATNDKAAAEFINKVVPDDIAEKIEEAKKSGTINEESSGIYKLPQA